MAPKFRRSRVSVMYRFLIVVCSSDLKWGKRVVETVTVAAEIYFLFIKFFINVALRSCIIIARKIAKRHTLWENWHLSPRQTPVALNSHNRFEIYRLIQVVSLLLKTSIVPSGTICFSGI